MKNLRKKLQEKLIAFKNRHTREKFFSHINSEFSYKVHETKYRYEMIFEDGCITTLPKPLFSFIKRWEKGDRASLNIGKNTYLQNLKLDILWDQQIRIGSFCSFGPNVVIKPDGVRGKAQFTQYPLTLIDQNTKVHPVQIEKARTSFVHIGNDCFIGEDAKIMANVIVNDGVIIGERSLVTSGKVLEPFGIYAGIPAKLIGYRYSPEIINELMRIQWWNWPIAKIRESGLQHIDFMASPDEALRVLRTL